jgi:hypothetical protein
MAAAHQLIRAAQPANARTGDQNSLGPFRASLRRGQERRRGEAEDFAACKAGWHRLDPR